MPGFVFSDKLFGHSFNRLISEISIVIPEALTEAFTKYGQVTRVNLPTNRKTGRLRGFGFVEMSTAAEAAAASDALDGAGWVVR